jgi:hypothetical protein
MILAGRRIELQVDCAVLLLQLGAARIDRLDLPSGDAFPFEVSPTL